MTALIDWREDASLPSHTASWPLWTLAMLVLAVACGGLTVVIVGPFSDVKADLCGMHEAREGIPDLEKFDVPLVGHTPEPGWIPPANVRVRYASSDDFPSGVVVGETECGQPTNHLLVTIAR